MAAASRAFVVNNRLSLSVGLEEADRAALHAEAVAAIASGSPVAPAQPPPLFGRGPEAAVFSRATTGSLSTQRFDNPIIAPPSADPWMTFHQGWYYYCESRNHTTIHIRRSRSIVDIGSDTGVKVWTPPRRGKNSKGVWAPELHLLDGKWYIYYAADDGENENHRMWILESEGSDPLGPYVDRGSLDTQGWAIDGTVFTARDGKLYFVWSGWPGPENGCQNLYIAPMSDPLTISGDRVLLTKPEHDWERVEMSICEGPQVLRRDDRLFIVYSASGSWTVDYCLGLLEFLGGDLLDPSRWVKRGPALCKTRDVWGVGHCSFVQSPDGTEDWILFHAKSKPKNGWSDRNVHAQRFSWKADGTPDFGVPASPGTLLPVPSAGDVESDG